MMLLKNGSLMIEPNLANFYAMKQICFLLWFFFLSNNSLYSQEYIMGKIDFKKIEKVNEKKSSPYLFKTLLERYSNNDTTFTLEEKRYLYYGFIFQDNYAPYGICAYSDSVHLFLKKDSLSGEDYLNIVSYSLICLEKNPFDIGSLRALAIAYAGMGDVEKQKQTLYRIDLIYKAIMSSGDGITQETAFSVLFVSHEYNIIRFIGLEFEGTQSLLDGQFDYLTLVENQYGIEGLYFDISQMIASLSNSFKK